MASSPFRQIPPCRIDPGTYAQLAALAKSDDRSTSYVILLFIAEGLARHGDLLADTSEQRAANSALVASIRRKTQGGRLWTTGDDINAM
jgi:hypothetical protein